MARPRQPIELLIAKGNKHLGKEEIEKRKASEVKPCIDEIVAPPSLTKKKQKDEFYKIAYQLQKLNIIGETDVDTLARYIISRDLYIDMTKKLNSRIAQKNLKLYESYAKLQDRFFKQCRMCAIDLGLTISSRCKLVIPQLQEETKQNKFSKFKNGNVN